MFGNRSLVNLVLGVSLLTPVLGLSACTQQPVVAKANVAPGAMPADGSWRGVFYDPIYGYLHLLQSGDQINGKWRTSGGDKWGELHGNLEGNLLRFEWTEHRIGMFGPAAQSSGKGYFKYIAPPGENVDHELNGEWGLDQADAGHVWKCVKQRNMEPDPNSVMPDETTANVNGADWDDSAKKNPNAAGADKKKSKDDWE
jgi:hypothetical protein